MSRLFLLGLFVFYAFQLSAQDAISGFVNLQNSEEWNTNVQLSKLSLRNLGKEDVGQPVAIARIGKNGSFRFNKKYISEADEMYRLSVHRIQKIVNDTVKKEVDFILSNKDVIQFKKGKSPFANFKTTSKAHIEWEKFQGFQSNLVEQYKSVEEKKKSQKGFVKDSLQILMVKLIGIKQLESKQLLDIDIAENETYYLSLLLELQSSDLNPSAYSFLERKLAYLTNVTLEKDLQHSQWLNVGLSVLVLVLGFVVFKGKRKHHLTLVSQLSKQEKTVRNLILDGKTNKEIANELFISLSTVKSHITNIYSKLNVTNRKELLQKSTGTST